MDDEKLIEAIENIRRDKKNPIRYIFFTFLNGIAQGFGVALGATIVLGIAVYILTNVISSMISFPVVGHYFAIIGKLIDSYAKSAPQVR